MPVFSNGFVRIAALFAAFAVLAAACAPAPTGGSIAPTVARGGTLTEPATGDASTMQPLLASDTASNAFIQLHYNAPLLRYDPQTLALDAKGGTVERYVLSSDGLTITFTLREGLEWSDGTPMTAEDYRYTFERMAFDTATAYPFRSNLRQFAGVAAPDARTLVFTLKEAFCPALSQLAFQPVPKHVFGAGPIAENPATTVPTVGSGPWILKEWVKGSYAVFEANERFYLGRPNLDKYVVRVVKDATLAYAMLKSGEVDIANVRAEDWDDLVESPGLKGLGYYPATASWTFIGFNLKSAPLDELAVRQAIAHAIDRDLLINRIRQGHARPLDTIFASESWAASSDVSKTSFNAAKAKELLDNAGWKAGNSGIREKAGKPLKLRIHYNAGNRDREQISIMAQQMLKSVGIESDVVAEEFGAYLNRINRTKDFDLFVLGWTSSLDPHATNAIWTAGGSQNSGGLALPQLDSLYAEGAAASTCTNESRLGAYKQIQKLVTAQTPYVFLWESETLIGTHERLAVNPVGKLGHAYAPWLWGWRQRA